MILYLCGRGHTSVSLRGAIACALAPIVPLLQFAVVSTATAGTIYVDSKATGADSGASWRDAFTDLRAAIQAAPEGSQVWVAAGVYVPSTTDNTVSFELRNGVELYGGFSGHEMSLAQRDPQQNETVLSGDRLGDDNPLTFFSGQKTADNARHVVTGLAVNATAVLDGFTIRSGIGGDFMGACSSHNSGGGIALSNASPTIRQCLVTLNRAIRGAGCVMGDGSAPLIESCTFLNNGSLGNGGSAIAACGSSPSIFDSEFIGNHDLTNGAGTLRLVDGSTASIRRCRFVDNYAAGGGGGVWSYNSSPTEIESCLFLHNEGGGGTGGVAFQGDEFKQACDGIVRDSVFVKNKGNLGGGIMALTSSPLIEGCTFVANETNYDYGSCIGVYFLSPNIRISNSILWMNSRAGVVDEKAQVSNETIYFDVSVNNSCIDNWTGTLPGVVGIGNFGRDPQFVYLEGVDGLIGTEDDDLRLLASSPCIDAGDMPSSQSGVCLDGMPRVLDGDLDGAAAVDIGAFEHGNVHLNVAGGLTPGETITLDVTATEPLLGYVFIGHPASGPYIDPFGSLLFDPMSRWLRLAVGPLPTSLAFIVPTGLPTEMEFSLQALGLKPAMGAGNLSNAVLVEAAAE